MRSIFPGINQIEQFGVLNKNRERENCLNIFSGFSLSSLSSLSPTSRNPLFLTLFSPDPLFFGKFPDRRRAPSQACVPTTLAYPWFDGLRRQSASKQSREPSCSSRPDVAPVTSPPPPTSSSSRSARGAARSADQRRGVFQKPRTKTTTPSFLHLLRAPPSLHGGAANRLGWFP